MSTGGRVKYVGPTALSQFFFKDVSTPLGEDSKGIAQTQSNDPTDTSMLTRAPSPIFADSPAMNQSDTIFPFNLGAAQTSTKNLLSHLPVKHEASVLVDCYFRYCAWQCVRTCDTVTEKSSSHDVIPRDKFQPIFDRLFATTSGDSAEIPANPQEIALVFIVMAQGTMFNLELPYNDPSAAEFLRLAEQALVKGEFMSNNMVIGLQTLVSSIRLRRMVLRVIDVQHLMAHLHL